MDNEKIKAALADLNLQANRKLGEPMYIPFVLRLDGEKWRAFGYEDFHMTQRHDGPFCDAPDAAIADMLEKVLAWPSEAERDLQEFQRKVADAIDFGNENGIAAEWLNPIVEVARGLASNAITKQVA